METFILENSMLFRGLSRGEVKEALDCLGAMRKGYAGNETIYHAGEPAPALGIVLSGSVLIDNYDIWSHRSILDRIAPGGLFAEAYACIPGGAVDGKCDSLQEPEAVPPYFPYLSQDNPVTAFILSVLPGRTAGLQPFYHSL